MDEDEEVDEEVEVDEDVGVDEDEDVEAGIFVVDTLSSALSSDPDWIHPQNNIMQTMMQMIFG